jgi:hypothetical protein
MGQSGMKKLKEIRRSLDETEEKERNNMGHYTRDQIEKCIMKVAGTDKRTIEKHFENLKKLDLMKKIGLEDEQGNELYFVDPIDPLEEKVTNQEMETAPKTVNVKAPEGLVDKADSFGVNKSDVFRKALLEELNSLERLLDEKIPKDELEDKEISFVKEIIEKGAIDFKSESRRNQIYNRYFDQFNEVHVENLRQKAFQSADRAGFERKPSGLR